MVPLRITWVTAERGRAIGLRRGLSTPDAWGEAAASSVRTVPQAWGTGRCAGITPTRACTALDTVASEGPKRQRRTNLLRRCPPGRTIGRARLDPSGLTPGRLFGEPGSILCSRSRVRGAGTLQVSRHETLEKPETASIVTRASGRREGFRWCFWPSRRDYSRRVSSIVAPMPQTPKPAPETAPGPTITATDSR